LTEDKSKKAEHWPQYSWRPWCGFLFPVAVVLIYFGLPAFGKVVPAVPVVVWIGWLAILGVSAHGRNKEKIAAAGGNTDGLIVTAVKAIRGH
jgi:hypothetical protein